MLKEDMTLQEVHAFINDLWMHLIKPTWCVDLPDWERCVEVVERLAATHGDSVLTCKMINAYLIALETKQKRQEEQSERFNQQTGCD